MSQTTVQRPCKLFTPGPVNIPNRVALASAVACYHHRSAEFSAILRETLEQLKPIFGTTRQVLPIHTTGRGAMEGVINNLLTKEDCVIAICNGSFGAMAAKVLEKNGIPCVRCYEAWTDLIDLAHLEKLICEHHATAITVVHNDTSNGMVNPIQEIGALARKYDLTLIVDAVSASGCMPFQFDEWGVDAVVTASQKGLMSAAGLSFAVLSEKAQALSETIASHDYYINLKDIRKTVQEKGETPGSTPVSLVVSVSEALKMIQEEGLENTFARHQALARGTRAALQALGFPLFLENSPLQSDSLTVALLPEGVDVSKLVAHMQNHYRILVGKGLGDYANKTLRIAHMGYCYEEDMLQCIATLEAAMIDLGYLSTTGAGTGAFLRAVHQ